MTAATALGSARVARDSAVVREDFAMRSEAAAARLRGRLGELEAIVASLGDVSTALGTASEVVADLEAALGGGPPSDPAELQHLVDLVLRLAQAVDSASPEVLPVPATGLGGPNGPPAVEVAPDPRSPSAEPTAVGFGPFVLQYPVPGHGITSGFGENRGGDLHNGIDIGAPAGTPILSAADGVVELAGWLDAGAGNGVILRHDGGWQTRYFHMITDELPVAVGDRVAAGQVIGHVGSTGRSTGPHLHFEIVFGPVRMDPEGSFIYIGRDVVGDTGGAPSPPLSGGPVPPPDAPRVPVVVGPLPQIAELSRALQGIEEVQDELVEVAFETTDRASELEALRLRYDDRARSGAVTLFGGAVLVALGLMLLWVTRPLRWSVR